MPLFRKKKRRVFGVMDVGSDAIKALLFAVPPPKLPALGGRAPVGTGLTGTGSMRSTSRNIGSGTTIQPIEKFVWELPEQYTGVRLARKIREGVFRMIQHTREVPEQFIIAMGPTVAESGVHTWHVGPGTGPKIFTRRDIRAAYHDLFAAQRDLRRAAIVAPVEVLVNGYPIGSATDVVRARRHGTSGTASRGWRAFNIGQDRQRDAILPRSQIKDIAFRTLSMHMTVENGATFAEIKNALTGMPIEFIPLAVAYKEAVVRGLGIHDALLVDVGGAETTIVLIRNGMFSHAAFIPLGTRRFAEHLAQQSDQSFRDAQKTLRTHATFASVRQKDRVEQSVAAVSASAARQWKQSFVAALGLFFPAGPIPETLLLTGGGAHIPELRATLLADDWMGNVSHVRIPKLRVLEANAFFGGDTLDGHVSGPEDAGLAALAVYARVRQPVF